MISFAAIADDFTGGSDLASMIADEGVPTALIFGQRHPALLRGLNAQAMVACFKSRSVPAAEARAVALEAHAMLRTLQPRQYFFKYCSTFDSTPAGNIGPVLEELLALTQVPYTIAVPALPVNGRTQYLGHLFVNGAPLHESSLARHPINPMKDSNLLRWLGLQTKLPLGLIDLRTVRQGPLAIRAAFAAAPHTRVFFLDATEDSDLAAIAAATHDLPFLSGGSGIGAALPKHWPRAAQPPAAQARPLGPRTLILSGSCSDATLAQLERLRSPGVQIHALTPSGYDETALLEDLAKNNLAVLASSSSTPISGASHQFEKAFGAIARQAVEHWQVERLIVAGGETSGAVVSALDIPAARLVSTIAPGVPALLSIGAKPPASKPLGLALKSGNFGGQDFFTEAQRHLEAIRT
jgi:3-dehydrotetronate 4-kinase